jgi:plasmid maintenance system antidote protein VapI
MEKISIFKYLDYKDWLSDWLKEAGHGSVSRLAEAIECQRSYVSQVINTHVHVTPDQAFRIGNTALDGAIERKYLSLLVEMARAGDHQYKSHILEQIESIRSEATRLEKIVGRDKELQAESAALYYSAWYYSAIHIATSIEPALNEEDIANGLKLDVSLVKEVLRKLENYKLVEFKNNHYRFKIGGHHLTAESPFLANFHQMWRRESVANFNESKVKEGVRYTLIQTLSQKDYLNFQEELRSLIKRFEQVATPSAPEVMINLNLDFAKVFKS